MTVWYKGERYKSVQALISELNIENLTPAAVYSRLRRGWLLEDALDYPMHPLIASVRGNAPHEYVDHTGRRFETLTAMARTWGLTRDTLQGRLDRGWDIERALTEPVSHYRGGQTVDPPERTDHTGKEWPSQAAMASAWGISPAAFHTRRYKKGMSIEEALTAKKRPQIGRPGKLGHEFIYAGTRYNSVAELCRALEIPMPRTYARLVRGVPVDDAVRDVLPDDRRCIRKP